jgi:hypothetical protein
MAEKTTEYLDYGAGEVDAAGILGEIINLYDIQIDSLVEIIAKAKTTKSAKPSPVKKAAASPLKMRMSNVGESMPKGLLKPQDAGLIKSLEQDNQAQAEEIKRLKAQIKQLNSINLKKS